MIKLKYSKYEDFKQDLVLREGIADLTPYNVKLPDPPPMEKFINFGLPIEEQLFVPDDIPTWVTRFNKEIFRNLEERDRLGVIINANQEYTSFIAEQWRKRQEGIWIYIHGKPIHITGLNWFFLNHYKHIQKLDFRYEDTEYFYWWKYCVKDVPSVMGGMELARRQEGKCLSINTLCKLYNGKDIKVQDICNGNLLMGTDGLPRVVSGVTSGEEEMFWIEPYAGEPFGCNRSHILILNYKKDCGNNVRNWKVGDNITISVKDYLNLPQNTKDNLFLYRYIGGEYEYTNFTIKSTGIGKYYGFQVDQDHCFLLHDGMVIHNSTRAGVVVLEDITKGENKYCGLQSKDEQSITSFMSKCIVNPYNKLPFYFRPVNNSSKLAPKEKLEFRHPQDIEDSLMNTIEARANSLKAFDGETLTGYVEDEAGKQDKLLITEKWGVHRETLRVLGGKAIVTSTVEETTNGGMKEYAKLWSLSDHAEVNLLGETETGLVRYFRPSYQTIRFDRYGFSIIDDPTEEQYQFLLEKKVEQPRMGGKEFIDVKIDSVKDSLDRAKLIRKYPRTIREAFRKSANNCEFDIIKLTQQQDKYLYKDSRVIGGNPDIILGNLSWKDNKPDTEVIFTECEHGRWKFNRAIFPYLSMNGNQTINHGLHKYPKVKDLGCLGADAFKYGQTDEKRKSLGTITGYINYDMAIEDKYIEDGGGLDKLTDNIFVEYGWRQSSTDLYSEDCLMTSVFCGMPIFPEINVNCIVEHYMRRGYYGFLKFRKIWARLNGAFVAQTSNKAGMQTTGGEVLNSLFNYVNDYICHDIHRCVFPDTISDFIQVEKGLQKDYDYFVSAAYALYGAKNKKGKENVKKEEEATFSDPLGLI